MTPIIRKADSLTAPMYGSLIGVGLTFEKLKPRTCRCPLPPSEGDSTLSSLFKIEFWNLKTRLRSLLAEGLLPSTMVLKVCGVIGKNLVVYRLE